MSDEELISALSNMFCNDNEDIDLRYTDIIYNSIIEKDKEIERLNTELQVQIEDNTRLNEYIEEQDKELELERRSRQLLIDDLANVCEMSLKKDNIIKEAIEYIEDNSHNSYFSMLQADYNMSLDTLLEILKGNDKE